MRRYDYRSSYSKLLTPEIVGLLSQIHEYRGEQRLLAETEKDNLTQLQENAKIQSAEASNKIEDVYTSDDRLKMIVLDKTVPKSSCEKEIAGYRDVLATILEGHDYIPPKPSFILQLHRALYKYSGMSVGGSYKSSDEVDTEDNEWIRCSLVSAWETAESIENACSALEEALQDPSVDDLIIIPMFILDFLCIQPFRDGNRRLSRLVTLLLLYRSGYTVGKYTSIEHIMERTKSAYFDTLQGSSKGWNENVNDYAPFVNYLLGVVLSAYQEFSSQVKLMTNTSCPKPERVREIIKKHSGKITKSEIMAKCPDISRVTVQRALNDMVKNGTILKICGGRYTAYTWNGER